MMRLGLGRAGAAGRLASPSGMGTVAGGFVNPATKMTSRQSSSELGSSDDMAAAAGAAIKDDRLEITPLIGEAAQRHTPEGD